MSINLLAQESVVKAKEVLEILDDSSSKQILSDIADFVLERNANVEAYELLQDPSIGDKYTDDEKDLMLMALLIHDGLKSGNPQEKAWLCNQA